MPIVILEHKSAPRVMDILVPLADRSLAGTVKTAEAFRRRLRNPKGNTDTGNMRFIGQIPAEVWNQNSKWFDDDDNVRRWLRENSKFQVGKL